MSTIFFYISFFTILFFVSSCVTTQIGNDLSSISLEKEPLVKVVKDPDIDFSKYETFFVFLPSLIYNDIEYSEIEEKQFVYDLRNNFEKLGYTFLPIEQNPDFLIIISPSSKFKEHYVPPQTVNIPTWVPGRTQCRLVKKPVKIIKKLLRKTQFYAIIKHEN